MNGDIRRTLHQVVLSRLDARKAGMSFSEDPGRWQERAEEFLAAEMSGLPLGGEEQAALRQRILDEIFDFGPITPLLSDPAVSEIMVNGYESIYVERDGLLTRHGGSFLSEESLRATIDRMVSKVNRRLDESSPYVDARLPDGSRINAIIPPVCLSGACLTVRKFRKEAFSLAELVRIGSVAEDGAEYLREAVRERRNIIVSGGTGSGKTTLLNALSQFIPEEERIVTIEDAAEIRLQKPHVIRLEARPANIEGSGAVTIRDLVRNSLRMRPDRIIVGECRGGEALDMLQAMNTGHDGSITTGHANTPRDMLRRLETMVLLERGGDTGPRAPGADRLRHRRHRPHRADSRRKKGGHVDHRNHRDERIADPDPGTVPMVEGERGNRRRGTPRGDGRPFPVSPRRRRHVGLTPAEAGIFVLGAALIARFLLQAALPRARTRFASAANRHSSDLREEFVLLPPTRIAAALLASATVLAVAALAATRSIAVAAASAAAPALFAGLLVRWYRNRRKTVHPLPAAVAPRPSVRARAGGTQPVGIPRGNRSAAPRGNPGRDGVGPAAEPPRQGRFRKPWPIGKNAFVRKRHPSSCVPCARRSREGGTSWTCSSAPGTSCGYGCRRGRSLEA